MGVVEHFENGPLPAFREAHRVLKPNGLIFVLVPTVNLLRHFIRRPFRKAINAFPAAFMLLKQGWTTSKRGALLAASGNILPGDRGKYYHFFEYRYSKSELESFLRQAGFEIVETVPNDFYGSQSHAVGLVVDFPFLGAGNGANYKLNPVGKAISRICDRLSPWIACSAICCVARVLKASPDSE
jgi:SAM-dependent methyltransferase